MNKLVFYCVCLSIVVADFTGCAVPTKSKVEQSKPINRQQWVSQHNPTLKKLDPQSPFTLGNGQFAFTADVTGLQSFYSVYFEQGIPLETKAKWAWHQRANPANFKLDDANQSYAAYGRADVEFPTNMDEAAGQWLRKNPHDLPLFRASFNYLNEPLKEQQISNISQTLNMFQGRLTSQFTIAEETVEVSTVVAENQDALSASIESQLLTRGLSVVIQFPRGYDLAVKNTPRIDMQHGGEHFSKLIKEDKNSVLILREIDDARHYVQIQWRGDAEFKKIKSHQFSLSTSQGDDLEFSIRVLQEKPLEEKYVTHQQILKDTALWWQLFWQSGAAVEFTDSSQSNAKELERRIVLSRYLMAAQSRGFIPPQETGLTSSSWYGKHHSEMTFWHAAHWILWGNTEYAERVLDWYLAHLPEAKELAAARGLAGARWAKMVGPNNRESPGGNPLIIWNQPQMIHLAELLYMRTRDEKYLKKYLNLVEQSALAMSSMLVFDEQSNRYNLEPPIWIAQEIYDPKQTQNPTFELAYWRYGLQTALNWQKRLSKNKNDLWQQQLDSLATLPVKDDKYVAIESIPDTFNNRASRRDHPSMLAAYGMLKDPTVYKEVMSNTLIAVMETWDWQEKIWGWDYPMIAMTAARLERPEVAMEMLLANLTHNRYLNNGHVPQPGANLPVYLPANGALLTAIAMILGECALEPNGKVCTYLHEAWHVKAEGFAAYP